MYSAAALTLVALLAAIDTVQCVECYQCMSADDYPNNYCHHPNDKLIVDCSSSGRDLGYFETRDLGSWEPTPTNALDYYCAKLVMSDGDSSRNIIVRGCVKEGIMNETCQEMVRHAKTPYVLETPHGPVKAFLPYNKKIKDCTTCNSERCNGAAGTASSVVLALGLATLPYLAYH